MEGNTSATNRMAAGIRTFIIAPATPEAFRISGLWDVLSISRRNCMTVQGSRVKAARRLSRTPLDRTIPRSKPILYFIKVRAIKPITVVTELARTELRDLHRACTMASSGSSYSARNSRNLCRIKIK